MNIIRMGRFAAVGMAICAVAVSAAVAREQTTSVPAGPATSATPIIDAAYRLGPGDKVRVTTFGEETLTGEFLVGASGDVSMPLVGAVKAGGLSVVEFTALLQQTLANGYLRDPKVSVEVLSSRPFYILGEVSRPGEYPFISGLTVVNAAATAGGFTYRANIHRVFIKHTGSLKEERVKLTEATPVAPGDTIRIPERFF